MTALGDLGQQDYGLISVVYLSFNIDNLPACAGAPLMSNVCLIVGSSLHSELRVSVERQLQALPVGSGLDGESVADDVILKSLKDQLEHAGQVSM